MTILGTPGYKNLRTEFSVMWDGSDPWGSALSWWFAIAEFLYHHDEGEVPEEWEFRDSPAHYDGFDLDDRGAEDAMIWDMYDLGEFTLDDALTFGRVLSRYLDILRAADKDY